MHLANGAALCRKAIERLVSIGTLRFMHCLALSVQATRVIVVRDSEALCAMGVVVDMAGIPR